MGQLAATLNSDNEKRSYTLFLHGGQRVCKKTFTFLHGIGKKRLHNVGRHFSIIMQISYDVMDYEYTEV